MAVGTERSTLVLQRVPQCVMTVDTSSVHEASHRRVAKCGAGGKGPQRLDRVFDARSRVEWSPCPLPNVQLHFTRSARRMWKRGPGFPSLPPAHMKYASLPILRCFFRTDRTDLLPSPRSASSFKGLDRHATPRHFQRATLPCAHCQVSTSVTGRLQYRYRLNLCCYMGIHWYVFVMCRRWVSLWEAQWHFPHCE